MAARGPLSTLQPKLHLWPSQVMMRCGQCSLQPQPQGKGHAKPAAATALAAITQVPSCILHSKNDHHEA